MMEKVEKTGKTALLIEIKNKIIYNSIATKKK